MFEYLRNYSVSGTIISTSTTAIKRLTKEIVVSQRQIIVELGGGTGKVTRLILKRMNPEGMLYCFEIQSHLITELRKIKDPRLVIIEDSAVNILKYLAPGSVDIIISTLPLSFIDHPIRATILKCCYLALKTNGILRQLSFLFFPAYFKAIFNKVKIEWQIIDMPPAILYYCCKS